MSGTLGNLAVVLTLDSSGFSLGMAQATKSAQGLKSALDGVTTAAQNSSAAASSAGSAWANWSTNAARTASLAQAAAGGLTSAMSAQLSAVQASTAALQQQLQVIQQLQAVAAKGVTLPGSGGGFSFNAASLAGLAAGLLGIGGAAAIMRDGLRMAEEQFNELVQAGDRFTASVNQIQAVMGTSRAVAQDTYSEIEHGAQRAGVETSALAANVARFAVSMQAVGLTRSQIVEITTGLAEFAAVTGTDSAAASRAMRELNEGLATGSLNLRQLKVVGQDWPALLDAIAKALGVTTGQLEAMAHAGTLTADTVTGALEKIGASADQQLGSLPRTLENSRTALADSLQALRANIDQQLDLSQTLSRWDRFWADLAQRAADQMDPSKNGQLARLKEQLAELKQEAASAGDGAGGGGLYATPTFGASLDLGSVNEQIANVQRLIDAKQKEIATQDQLDQANASSAAQQNRLAQATEAMQSAMDTLGLSNTKSTAEIQHLADAIAHGTDVAVPFENGMLRAGDVLDLLRAKADPAAKSLAELNRQVLQAQAQAQGGFAVAQLNARLAADPADPTGSGKHLSAAYKQQQDQLLGLQFSAGLHRLTQKSMQQLALAQARRDDPSGYKAGVLSAGYARDQMIADYGPGATDAANTVYNNSVAEARISATKRQASATRGGTDAVTQLKAKLAELQASTTGDGTETAKWTQLLQTATPAVRAHSAEIMQLTKQIDAQTAANKAAEASRTALKAISGRVSQAHQDAADALADQGDGERNSIQRSVETVRRQMAREMVSVAPADQQRAASMVDDATMQEGLAALRRQVDANQTAAREVLKSWDDTLAGRRAAALAEVDNEKQQLGAAIAAYATSDDERKRLTDETAAYIATKYQQAMRQTESATEKLGREWSDTNNLVDQSAASLANTFTEDLANSLSKGKSAFSDFADVVIQQLERIAAEAALSPLVKLLGSSVQSGLGSFTGLFSGSSSLPGTDGFGDAANPWASLSVNAAGHHAGGIVGFEPTFNRTVPADLFDNARRYHTGGIVGNEIPAILQKGEGVFTRGQMAAMGSGNNGQGSAPNVSFVIQNSTGQPMTAAGSVPKFDGEKWVVDIMVKNASKPGPFRDTLRNANRS